MKTIKGAKNIKKYLDKNPKAKIKEFSYSIDNKKKVKEEFTLDEKAFKRFGSLIPTIIKGAVKANATETVVTIENMTKGLGANLVIKVTFTEEQLKKAQELTKV